MRIPMNAETWLPEFLLSPACPLSNDELRILGPIATQRVAIAVACYYAATLLREAAKSYDIPIVLAFVANELREEAATLERRAAHLVKR